MKNYTVNIDAFCKGTEYVDKSGALITGVVKSYYDNGQLEYSVNVINGKQDGIMNVYRTDGTQKFNIPFVNGQVHGDLTFYLEDNIEKSCTYKNGELVAKPYPLNKDNDNDNDRLTHLHDPYDTSSGEHQVPLGDMWAAIYQDIDDDLFLNLFKKIQGEDVSGYQVRDIVYFKTKYTDLINHMMVVKITDTKSLFMSAYPCIEGLKRKYGLLGLYRWDAGIEGEAFLKWSELGAPLCVIDLYYTNTHYNIFPGTEVEVALSGLVAKISKLEDTSFFLEEGLLYIVNLCIYLRENADISKCRKIESTTAGSRTLLPTPYACYYSFQCSVQSVQKGVFDGLTFYAIDTILVGIDSEEVPARLCVFENVLKGYVPQVGDDIIGTAWLSAMIETPPKDFAQPHTYALADCKTAVSATGASTLDFIFRLKILNAGNYQLTLKRSDTKYIAALWDNDKFYIAWDNDVFEKVRTITEPIEAEEAARIFKLFLDNNIAELKKLTWGTLE